MRRFKEWAWRCWDFAVEGFYTINHWLDVIFFPVEQRIVSLIGNLWLFKELIAGFVGVVVGLFGCYNTILLFFNPQFNPILIGMILLAQVMAIAFGAYATLLGISNEDENMAIWVKILGAYLSYYFKPGLTTIASLFANLVGLGWGHSAGLNALLF